jgi:hypothetical protein
MDRRVIELYHNDMSVCAQKVRFALGGLVVEEPSSEFGAPVINKSRST